MILILISNNRINHKNRKTDYYISYLIFNKNEPLYQIYMRYYEPYYKFLLLVQVTLMYVVCTMSLWYCHSIYIWFINSVTNTAKNNDVMHVTRCTFYLNDGVRPTTRLTFSRKITDRPLFHEKCRIRSRFYFLFRGTPTLGEINNLVFRNHEWRNTLLSWIITFTKNKYIVILYAEGKNVR